MRDNVGKQNDWNEERSEADQDVRNHSEPFGSVQNDSESFGKVPQDSEAFGSVPRQSESVDAARSIADPDDIAEEMQSLRTEFHTLTVKEAARQFEEAGVARTERSVVNWCQRNKDGVPRLDCYFDRNERRYFITPQSVNAVIEEEKARQLSQIPSASTSDSSTGERVRKDAEAATSNSEARFSRSRQEDVDDLKSEIELLQVENRVKAAWIKQLKAERADILSELRKADYQIGSLETQLRLEAPARPESDEQISTFDRDNRHYQDAVVDRGVEGGDRELPENGGGDEVDWKSI